MLTCRQIDDTPLIEIAYDGHLGTDEMKDLRALLDAVVAEHGEARLLMEYGGVGRMEPAALWEDLKMERFVIARRLTRMAVLTDKKWLDTVLGLADRIGVIEARTFGPGAREEALTWLRR